MKNPESSTTTQTEATPDYISPVDIDGVPAYLQPSAIEELRHKQQVATWNEMMSLPDLEAISPERQHEINEQKVVEYLDKVGVTQDDPHYQETYDYLRGVSADNISHYDWHHDDEDEVGTYIPSQRSRAFARLKDFRHEQEPSGADENDHAEDESKEEDVERGEALTDLEALAAEKHAAFANKVNGPAFGKKSEANAEAYALARSEYMTALEEQLKADIVARIDAGDTEDEVRTYIETEVNRRMLEDDTRQKELLEAAGGKKYKFLSWYANLSKGKKIGVTIGMGVGAGIIGAGVGILAGATGGGALAAGIAAVGVRAGRVGKSYMLRSSKIYENRELAQFKADGDIMDVHERGLKFMQADSDQAIERAHKIKRRAVYGAVGAAALGGALGTGLGIVEHVAIAGELSYDHWWGGFIQHIPFSHSAEHVTHPHAGDGSTHGGSGYSPNTVPGQQPPYEPGGGGTEHGHGGHTPGHEGHKSTEWKFGADERRISSGEGWYQTFHQMGIKPDHYHELLKETGPELRERGLAYWDGSTHEWRMNMTDNGKLPTSALRYIADTAHQHGFHSDYDTFFTGTSVDHAASATHEFSNGAEHIGKGEGFYHELGQMGVSASHQPEVLSHATHDLYDQGIAYKMSDGLPGIHMTPDHVMPQETLNTLHQAAVDSNVSDHLTTVHDHIVFDHASDAAGSTNGTNGEFVAHDIGKSYDADAKAYYNLLQGVDRSHWQILMNEAAPQLHSIAVNGEALTYQTADGWHFRHVDTLPTAARNALKAVASKHNWTLAA